MQSDPTQMKWNSYLTIQKFTLENIFQKIYINIQEPLGLVFEAKKFKKGK